MSLIDCLKGHIKEGTFTDLEIEDINRRFNTTYQNFRSHMSDHDAAVNASVTVMKNEISRLQKEQLNDVRSVVIQNKVWKSIERRAKNSESKRPEYTKVRLGYEEILDKADARKKTIRKEYYKILDDVFEEFQTDKITGLFRKNPLEEFQDMVRVALGEKPLDPANEAGGKALRAAFEYAHKRFDAAGGIIGKIPNFFPQTVHVASRIKSVPYNQWRSDIYKYMETNDIVNPRTGAPIPGAQFDAILGRIYSNITGSGREAALMAAEKNLPIELKDIDLNRAHSRFFKFKNAEAFFEYNNKYGHGPDGLYDVFLNYFNSMARDTANLEILGPRPKALHSNILRRLDAVRGRRGLTGRNWVDGQFQVLVGTYDGAPDEPLLRAIGNTQNILRAAYLGGAGLAAVGDTTFLVAAARLKGLPVNEVLSNYAKLINPANKIDRQIARDAGYIAEIVNGRTIADHKWTADNMGGRFTSGLANTIIKMSGLEHATKAARDAIALSMEANTARLVKNNVAWDDLAPELRDMFKSHGIHKPEWEVIRKVQPHEHPDNGVSFIRSSDIQKLELGTIDIPAQRNPRRVQFESDLVDYNNRIAEIDKRIDDLGDSSENPEVVRLKKERESISAKKNKTQETLEALPPDQPARTVPLVSPTQLRQIASNYDDLIEGLRDLATNESSLKTRALATGAAFGNAGPNSILRAAASSAFMFKTFPLQVMFNHLLPAMGTAIRGKGVGAYEHLATTVIGSMFMGALILQMKSIAQGKEPAPLNNWKFWRAAMLQGGGLGLVGDMALNEHRYGSGPFLSALKGPVIGTLDDGWSVFEKNFQRLMEDKPTKFFADTTRFLRKRTPGQNLIWTKLFTDRYLLDELEAFADDDFRERINRIRSNNIRDFNQDYYWAPGQSTGEALENIGDALDLSAVDQQITDDPLDLPEVRHFAKDIKEGRVIAAADGDNLAKKILTAKDITKENPGPVINPPKNQRVTNFIEKKDVLNAVIDLATEQESGDKAELQKQAPLLKQIAADFIRMSLKMGYTPKITDVVRTKEEAEAIYKKTGVRVTPSHLKGRGVDFRIKGYKKKDAKKIIDFINNKYKNEYQDTIPDPYHGTAPHFHIGILSTNSLYPKDRSKVQRPLGETKAERKKRLSKSKAKKKV